MDSLLGGSTPDEVAKVADEGALDKVVGGDIPDMEDKEEEIVSCPVVERPVADSSTAPTISNEEDKPGTPVGGPCGTVSSCAGAGMEPGSHPTGGTSGNRAAARPRWTEVEPCSLAGRPRWASPGLSHPTEGPRGANAHRCVVDSELGIPTEGTRTGNTLPGGIEIGGGRRWRPWCWRWYRRCQLGGRHRPGGWSTNCPPPRRTRWDGYYRSWWGAGWAWSGYPLARQARPGYRLVDSAAGTRHSVRAAPPFP